ncbi:MAG: YxeA family protein [Candidatus Nomurabacteria bacterium]|nr:YxeA family protein [Candidatus Nomurabacteria bacterium]
MVIVIAVVVVAALAIVGKNYYDSRYVGKDYYTVVPADFDATPETIYSASGDDMGKGKEYKLTAYNDQGEAKSVEWYIYTADSSLPQPGTYLRVSASQQIVTGWNLINEGDVPAKAMEKIKATEAIDTPAPAEPNANSAR